MLTQIGKLLRKLRIDRGEVLKDMADKLNVSSAYLSAVEIGKRTIPEHWAAEIIQIYSLDGEIADELRTLADASLKSIRLDIEGIGQRKREAALVFARSFEDMDDETVEKLIQMLKKKSEEM